MRIAVVGSGKAARAAVDGMGSLPEVDVKTSIRPSATMDRTQPIDFDIFKASCREADLVYIASPHDTHAVYADWALSLGKHVVVEKPAYLSTRERDRILASAHRSRRQVHVAMVQSSSPGTRSMLAELEQGRLGRLVAIQGMLSCHRDDGYFETWKGDPKRGGGIALNQAIHLVDLLFRLAPPDSTESQACLDRRCVERPVETQLSLTYESSGGAVCHGAATTDSRCAESSQTILIYGHEGVGVLDGCELPVAGFGATVADALSQCHGERVTEPDDLVLAYTHFFAGVIAALTESHPALGIPLSTTIDAHDLLV